MAGLLALGACRTDPLITAAAVPRASLPAPTVARPGVVIAVDVAALDLHARARVSALGTIDAPLCPGLQIGGLAAPAVCRAVAECLARQIRTAAIRVGVGDNPENPADLGGCLARGPAPTPGWTAASAQLIALAPRVDEIDPRVFVQAAEAAAAMETLLVAWTPEHPRVAEQRARLERLLVVAPDTRGEPNGAQVVGSALEAERGRVEAERIRLGTRYGDEHPQMRALATQIKFFTALADALPPSARVDPPGLLELDAVEAGATAPRPPADARTCAARLRAYDLRIARRRGQRSADPADAPLERVIDRLAIARAKLAAAPTCQPDKSSLPL